jgi:hypothetical protein
VLRVASTFTVQLAAQTTMTCAQAVKLLAKDKLLADIDLEDVGVVDGEDGFGVMKPRRPGGGRGFRGCGGGLVVSLSW